MRVSRVLLAVGLFACLAAALGTPTLSDIESDLSFLESSSARSSSAASVLKEAEKYAESKVNGALDASKDLLAKAAAAGRKEAEAIGPAPAKHVSNAKKAELKAARVEVKAAKQALRAEKKAAAVARKAEKKAEAKAAVEEKKLEKQLILAEEAKAKKVEREAKEAVAKVKAARAAKRRALGFSGAGLKSDKQGVFGAVSFGISKADSSPVPLSSAPKRTALERFKKFGQKKNIYGRRKSCLKDIAAHFDEKDIYDSKKLALLQQMSTTRSLAHAQSLRSKLKNLETWHQMMQKKFLMSATESKAHQRRVEKLFDEHLPEELKNQLAQNKVAKRAAQPIPFPDAQKQAFKILRSKRKQIQKMDRIKAHGHKRMLRPEINDKGFPSMDPISSLIREKLWRNVETQQEWSTDRAEFERAENIVTAAHKAHGDFVEGPIAEPMLRGKLYHPATEKLGVPNFLTKFPWPTAPETKITMNDKERVEQTYHQTW